VRELENMIHREYLFSEGPLIRITHASRHHAHLCRGNTAVSQDFKSAEAAAVMQPERTYILDILSRAGGNVSAAARMAGKEHSAFCRLVKKYRPAGEAVRT
jgi:DNA-binding NtrC family response regulator